MLLLCSFPRCVVLEACSASVVCRLLCFRSFRSQLLISGPFDMALGDAERGRPSSLGRIPHQDPAGIFGQEIAVSFVYPVLSLRVRLGYNATDIAVCVSNSFKMQEGSISYSMKRYKVRICLVQLSPSRGQKCLFLVFASA
jgi:hypothetical protein